MSNFMWPKHIDKQHKIILPKYMMTVTTVTTKTMQTIVCNIFTTANH